MPEGIIPKKIIRLLENAEFLCIATRDGHGNPIVANKFLIRCEGNSLYIGDFAKGKTWHNLKGHSRVSIAIMDTANLSLREFPTCEGGGESRVPRSGSGEARIT